MNSVIHIYLTTINNASLSRNSEHLRLLQERTPNSPTPRVTTGGRHQ